MPPIAPFALNGSTGTTLSWLAHLPRDTRQRHRAQYLNATSDLAASAVTFYGAGAPVLVTSESASGQAVVNVPGTGNFAPSDIVLVYDDSARTFYRHTVSSVTADTVTLSANLSATLVAGDMLIKRGSVLGAIPVGATTKEVNASGSGFFCGETGRALWAELTGTSACKINALAGDFVQGD
ncbi:hypothetical protein DB346_24400 [Verrucomicrobia bacterium LW23]|nr:hypothetical protein DB346_24400 [Verrucomicrobia bacterium LW23]